MQSLNDSAQSSATLQTDRSQEIGTAGAIVTMSLIGLAGVLVFQSLFAFVDIPSGARPLDASNNLFSQPTGGTDPTYPLRAADIKLARARVAASRR